MVINKAVLLRELGLVRDMFFPSLGLTVGRRIRLVPRRGGEGAHQVTTSDTIPHVLLYIGQRSIN